SFNIEYRIRDRFGNIHWFNDRTISIKKWQDETILEGLATDITPRKKAEEELRLSKHRLELHIKNTPLAVIEWTSDGMVRDWNPAAERIFGYSKEEILGQHWDIIVPDEAKDEIDDLWTKIVMRTGDGRSSNTNITKDGSVIQCEWYNTPLVDEQGKVMGVSSLVLDVTRRKLFEEALKSSEKKYRELLENIPQNIFYKDTQSIYISCNKNYANILKISEEDIAGKTDYDFYPKEMAESFRQDDQHVMAQDKITHIEEKYYEGDEERIAATIKTPVKDEMGKCIGVLGIFWDITEQKKTEDALRLSEQKYRQLSKEFNTLLDAIPDCILLLKPDMQIVWTNRAVTELVNKPVHELNGMSFQQFWNDWKVSDEMLPEDFTLHSGKIENIQINDSKGETLELRTFPIFDENNLLSNSIITITNITDKVKIEDEILKSQKLESIGILAGGIAHDFNNILTAISSNIGLAKLQSKPEDPFYENLQDAESVISQANRMSKQLITLARGGNPIKEVMDIKDLLQSTVEFTLRGSNVKPEFNIQLELWPVNADSGQLTQVINNMVFNARDAMADGGVLEVKAENLPENVESFLAPDVKHILISFKDYGKGISKDQQSKIFDPYYTTKSDGSGLGLSTTYSIIKKHEGLIDVISEQDIGTKFRIFLPAAGSEIPVDKSIAHKIIKGKGKILLMDDDEMVLKRTGDLLEYFGYHVIKAKNGEEAIELYKEEMETGEFFDAVILDLTVQGGMGGKKTIRRLLEINPDVRAIVVSGYSNDPILERFDEFGFRGAVAKPFSINELNEVIDRVLIAV
ncbi:MAG: PAS domain-containing protein, partial [Spirochaetota bacterium]|nr:PAS domain-containing protein [Spirochaetota bacterium]